MKKIRLSFVISFSLLAIFAAACNAFSPTPTPRPATPTLVALATLTPATLPSPTATSAPPTATVAPSATLTPTVAITPTRTTAAVTRAAATTAPRVTATTAFKPNPVKGNIIYHVNRDGVNRSYSVNLETAPFTFTPLFDIGPVMDVAGTATRGATNAHWADWSPDNSKIAYIISSGTNAAHVLRVRDLKTNTNRDLDSSETGGGLSSPSWSPAGDKIAYIVMNKNENVWTVRFAYYDPPNDPSERRKDIIPAQSQGQQFRGGLSWGKDGRIAIGSNTPNAANDIFLVNQDGSGFGALTKDPAEDTNPAWSPDGKQIAFVSGRAGVAQIYLMNADGTGLKRLSNNTFVERSPSWSSDGHWIAFTSVRDGVANIFIMDKNGGNVQQISKDGGDDPSWSR